MINKTFKLVLGWTLLVLGILGLLLPILQGILMIVGGLVILSSYYDWAYRLKEWFLKKFKREELKEKEEKDE